MSTGHLTIDLDAIALPGVFHWLSEAGGIAETEMLRTFNCGVGMIVVVSQDRADALTEVLSAAGETVMQLGHVVQGQGVRYKGALV